MQQRVALILLVATVLLRSYGAEPKFVTSDRNGGWAEGGYYIHNNMWNSAKYPCTSTLTAWSHDHWQVVVKANNARGDGAVKIYPNVHRDYRSVRVASFASLTSTFAERSPRTGIYNVAYDLWINGVAKPGCTEIMIWTENCRQVPAGRHVEDATFDGRAYRVYRKPSTSYIAFVAANDFTSGTVDLLEVVRWIVGKGWLAEDCTLNQICFGVEIVSTDDADATFQFSAFSIEEVFGSRVLAPPKATRAPAEK